ncbi:MAG TPA: class I SAM-dependent methyltransferase [Candidatus Cloacimonadota bacterium]|mgnify:CR=1 FL=1|nr:class I SAM-dependent methyltransferase [Candidatus Cloacimonadota bacterium]HPT71813.1 class I SAM-dependent methyltransferase [Candidatus Cloacimonadota bacterium]
MNYDAMYQNRHLWKEHENDEMVKSILPIILDWIPRDVKSVLDVGCGNVIITNELAKTFDVTGTDSSESALEYVKGKKVLASANQLPFEDKTFDLVFSSELLEHLPEEILISAVEEMKRVTRDYLFIAVSNHEYLPKNYTKCPECNTAFHVYGHVHSLSVQDLDYRVGPSFKRHMVGTFGPREKKYIPLLLKIRQKVANRWFQANENTICPQCGNKNFPQQKGNLISKLCNGLNLILAGKQRYWLFAFYERKDI